jgi:hypothetical protein
MTASVAAFPVITPHTLADVITDSNNITLVAGATIAINSSPITTTDSRAVGLFVGGDTAAGTLLGDPLDPAAAFSGGIGPDWGICLSTGFLSNNEPTRPPGFPQQVGVEGANNGLAIDVPDPDHEGETSKVFQVDPETAVNDMDWAAVHPDKTTNSGDPAVLKFQVDLTSPGFLCVSFVFGSDEFPGWITRPFNDNYSDPCKRTLHANRERRREPRRVCRKWRAGDVFITRVGRLSAAHQEEPNGANSSKPISKLQP